MGMTVAGGGGASTMTSAKPAPGWQHSLQPGDAVSGVLVTGDMSVSGMCTVTYNDRQACAGLRPSRSSTWARWTCRWPKPKC